MNQKAKGIFLNSILVLVSVLVGLGVTELVLRNFTQFPIHAPMGNRTFDDRLLYRMDTNLAGIDADGFRNPETYLDNFPKVAAVGDSFTYGYNVSREASWPGRLEAALGEPVYNYGGGGYSLLQYVDLVRLAVESGAKTIIVGILPENDMAICNASRLTYWNDVLLDGTEDGNLLKSFCSLDADGQRQSARTVFNDFNLGSSPDLESWLLANSALRSALRYVSDFVVNRRDNLSRNRYFGHNSLTRATEACARPDTDFIFPIFEEKDFIPGFHRNDLRYFDTVGAVTPAARAVVRRALGRMKHYAEEKQVRLGFLITAGRRRVVAASLAENSPDVTQPDWIASLASSEETLVSMFQEELEALGLPYTDALPLSAASYNETVKRGQPHYPCFDGHPLEEGYQALADDAMKVIGKMDRSVEQSGKSTSGS